MVILSMMQSPRTSLKAYLKSFSKVDNNDKGIKL